MCRHDYRSLDQFRGKALPVTVLRMVGEGDALPVLGRG
jgi:hypothetical protein